MQNLSSDFIIVNNEFGSSGQFMKLARNGQLMMVSKAIQHRSRLAKELVEIKAQLCGCNDPATLAEFAIWCLAGKRNFSAELKKKVCGLEDSKSRLQKQLAQLKNQLAQIQACGELAVDSATVFSGLVPRIVHKELNPYVQHRNAFIRAQADCTHQDTCKRLDFEFAAKDGNVSPDYLPDRWTREFRVHTFLEAYRHPLCRPLVSKMISSIKHTGTAS